MAPRQIVRTISLGIALATVVGVAGPARASVSHVKKNLIATSKAPHARGSANLVVRGSNGRLGVTGRRLNGGSTFEVIVDTVRIGTLTTNPGGSGKARFSTKPHGSDQLLGVDPRGKLVEVRDEDGDDVLETEMPDDGAPPPGATRCCLTDEDETECEQTTPAECMTEGGSDMGAGSCMPSPCASAPPGDQIQCCKADHDEDGPECELSTAAECSDENGTNLGAGSCDPNPCPATPPAAGEIACCVPDDDGPETEVEGADDGAPGGGGQECERVTADGCTALQGVNMGDVSCEPDPCVPMTPETTTTTTPQESTTTTTVL